MKTNTRSNTIVAIVVGILLIFLVTFVTSAFPKIEIGTSSANATTSFPSAEEPETFVSSSEPPYASAIEEIAKSGTGTLI